MTKACGGCGTQGVSTVRTIIPEDSTANKLAILELCAACAARRR